MAEFQRSQAETDTALRSRQSGAVALTVGWIFLGFAALLGIFTFNAIRDGDMVWPSFTGVLAVIGLVCVVWGLVIRTRR